VNFCQCVHSERDRVGESERASAERELENKRGREEGGRDTEMTVNDALRHRGREEGRDTTITRYSGEEGRFIKNITDEGREGERDREMIWISSPRHRKEDLFFSTSEAVARVAP
jgi:hypothetical protein